ncbi:SDR family NAD(P)-dependent oxidoreductase [Spirosoma litoris]
MTTVFITGAAGGLGLSVTQTLLTQGHRVLAAIHSAKDKQQLPTGFPDSLFTYEIDLTNEAAVTTLIEQAVTAHGPIDAAILLAGGYANGTLAETDGTLIDKMMTINFKTAYTTVQPLFTHMSQQPTGGRFVLIGARPALDAQAGKTAVAYALSKSLVFQLSDLINASGNGQNIYSTVIVPSIIDTALNRQAMPDADFTTWVDPQTIAETIVFVLFGEGRALREPVLKVYNQA